MRDRYRLPQGPLTLIDDLNGGVLQERLRCTVRLEVVGVQAECILAEVAFGGVVASNV